MSALNQYHFSAKVTKRSEGQSSVAAAAYRSGEKLSNELTGEIHDYTRKQDVVHAEIMAPDSAPEWMRDREQLWSNVEQIEKRKDAQLSRTYDMSFPKELTHEQQLEYARDFMRSKTEHHGFTRG